MHTYLPKDSLNLICNLSSFNQRHALLMPILALFSQTADEVCVVVPIFHCRILIPNAVQRNWAIASNCNPHTITGCITAVAAAAALVQ